MKFKLHMIREYKAPTEDNKEILSDERDITIDAPSCCEAIVLAQKRFLDYTITKWESLEDKTRVIPENSESKKEKSKKCTIELDPSQFTSNAEYRRIQHQISEMSQEKVKAFIEKHGYKAIS